MSNETKNDGGPAFPAGDHWWNDLMRTHEPVGHPGMSLRDWFAGQALRQIIHQHYVVAEAECAPNHEFELEPYPLIDEPDAWEEVAKTSYAVADAMLKARQQ